MPRKPTVTEQTAKRWKLIQLIGSAIAVVGLIVMGLSIAVAGPPAGVPGCGILFVGVVVRWTGQGLAWWYHG